MEIGMTNVEVLMTNEIRSPNIQKASLRHSEFVIHSTLVLGHSAFLLRTWQFVLPLAGKFHAGK